MKRKLLVIIFAGIAACTIFAGCGNTSASSDTAENIREASGDVREASDVEGKEESVKKPGADEKKDAASDEDITGNSSGDNPDPGSEENPYNGGPDWVTLADQFTLPTSRMCIEDAGTLMRSR